MANILDDATIDIPCPGCGKETEKSIGWIKTNSQFTCSGCGVVVRLEADQFREQTAEIEKMFRDFGDDIGSIK